MTQEQELAKLCADLAEARRRDRKYDNRVKVLTYNQRDQKRSTRTRRLTERGAILLPAGSPRKEKIHDKDEGLETRVP